MNLKYKDMYAIKHALKVSVKAKESIQSLIKITNDNNLTPDEIVRLRKDIEHEKRLIEKVETAISDFRIKNKF